MADGPLAGLALLDQVEGLAEYHLLHAAYGDLNARAGRPDQARAAFDGRWGSRTTPPSRRCCGAGSPGSRAPGA